MSETPTATAARPAAASRGPQGKKYAGLTRNQWLIGGGVFVAALVFIVWRRKKTNGAATASTATSTGSNECTDSNGNPVDCSELEAQELAALQNSLDQLGANSAGSGGSGAAGPSGATTPITISPATGTGATGTPQPSTATATKTTTGTTAPAAGGPITVIPIGLHTTAVNTTSVQVAWTAPTIPAGQGPLTGYTAEVYESNGTSEGPSWTVPKTQLYANAGGLKTKTAYHLNVWCEPAKTGGPHASVSFTTK